MRRTATTLESEISQNELAALTNAIRSANLSGPHLEIGTAAGGTLKELMKLYPDETRPRFVVVDPLTYFPDQRSIIEKNLRNSNLDPSEVDFRVGFSWPAFERALVNNERYSFVFIDGNHKAKYVMQDLAWTRLLDVGGVVALHDYKPKFRGVIWAVERFLRANRNYEKIAYVDSMVVLRKNGPSKTPEVSRLDILIGEVMNVFLRLRWSLEKRLAGPRT